MNNKTNIRLEIGLIACLWLISFVFRDWLVVLLQKIQPLSSVVPDESWWIQLSLLAIVGIIYAVYWVAITQSQDIQLKRWLILISVFSFYLLFRFDKRLYFYHLPSFTLSYCDVCFVSIVVIEFIVFLHAKYGKKKTHDPLVSSVQRFLYDTPAKNDSLHRKEHAIVLVKQICATITQESIESSFCVLLNERFGAGKSSFFNLIIDEAKKNKLDCIVFRPWLSDSPSSMMRDFLSRFEHVLSLDSPEISQLIKEYTRLLSGVQMGTLEMSFNNRLENASLTEKHDNLLTEMRKRPHPILALIDDVDRLDTKELLSLLKIIRNTVDFPYLCYLIAADKDTLSKNLREEKIIDPELYLQKFFNLEINFPSDDIGIKSLFVERMRSLLQGFDIEKTIIEDSIDALLKVESIWDVLLTPRDVYRFANTVSYSLEILRHANLIGEINLLDSLYLSIVQFISPEWFKVLRDRNDLLLDYNHTRGRYYLSQNKLKALYTRSVRDVYRRNHERDNQLLGTEEIVPDNQDSTLDSIFASVRVDPLDALKDVFYKLFGSETVFRAGDRMCYKNEYFKYFAGRYRINEVSTAEAFSAIEYPLDEYNSYLTGINSSDKVVSFVHKMLLYVEEGRSKDRVDVLKKLLLLSEKHFSMTDVSVASQFRRSTEEQVVLGLFVTSVPSRSPLPDVLSKEKDSFLQLYTVDERFQLLALILESIKKQLGMNHFIYGDKLAHDMTVFLIDRFIEEKVRKTPFSKDTYSVFFCMRQMNHVHWEEAFKQCVRSSHNPMAFIYNLITVSSSSQLVWNMSYINALDDNGSIPSLRKFATSLVGTIVDPVIADDMDTLIVGRDNLSLDEGRHPFVKAAMDWHRGGTFF